MNSKVNSKVNSKLDTTDWSPIDRQLLTSIQNVKTERRQSKAYFFGDNRDDWLDAMMYGLLFGTPEEIYRHQVHAKNEAEKEGRPYTPVFWTASEAGAGPVLTLWRIG
jgi:hypothetical protein